MRLRPFYGGLRLRLRFGLLLRLELLTAFAEGRALRRLVLGHSGRRLCEDLLREVELRDALRRLGGLLAILNALQRERKAAALGVDLDDLHGDDVALRDDL